MPISRTLRSGGSLWIALGAIAAAFASCVPEAPPYEDNGPLGGGGGADGSSGNANAGKGGQSGSDPGGGGNDSVGGSSSGGSGGQSGEAGNDGSGADSGADAGGGNTTGGGSGAAAGSGGSGVGGHGGAGTGGTTGRGGMAGVAGSAGNGAGAGNGGMAGAGGIAGSPPGGAAGASGGGAGGSPMACATDWELVPRDALSQGPDGLGGLGLRAEYSDSTVVLGEGPIWFGPHDSGAVPSWYPSDQLADASAPAFWRTIWVIGGETLTGYIRGPRTGSVDLGTWCDDYCSIEIPGLLSVVGDNTGSAIGTATVDEGVWYAITIQYQNRWGSSGLVFYRRCQ